MQTEIKFNGQGVEKTVYIPDDSDLDEQTITFTPETTLREVHDRLHSIGAKLLLDWGKDLIISAD